MFRLIGSCLVLLGSATVALAQGVPNAEYQLTVQPAREPVPALKHQLAFELRDQTPGNAAVHYFRAASCYEEKRANLRADKKREQFPHAETWWKLTLEELPRAEMHAFFDYFKPVLELVERAARCKRCDWELDETLHEEGIATLLPELQQLRGLAGLLQDKVRLDMAEGNLDQAVRTLRTGFCLARDCGQSPTLVSSMVGIAIGQIMLGGIDQFVQRPGAPNLYWALTDLPCPLIDVRRAYQGERMIVNSLFPGLREMASDPKTSPMTPLQIAELTNRLMKLGNPKKPLDEEAQRLAILNMAGRLHEDAKKFLVAEGRPAEEVEKLPMLQAALLYQLREYDRFLDDMLKLQGLPYYEGWKRLGEVEANIKLDVVKAGGVSLTLTGALLPAAPKVQLAQGRLERKISILRCVEAVRLYAAGHDGKPPAKLDDVKEMPIPLDPFTGKPFNYETDGDKAIIEGPPPDGEKPTVDKYIRYQVTLKK
ncbi:MAG TPA: hypothetical protein VKE94_12225 [Gemmataceae bacterium]|nr:hypothetical protein [Gemmataceae bacterium]